MSIPFAFAMGALISGQLDDTWIASVRKWTLGAWFFLSMGLTLGMLWAYEELGWGGFWGWDPVENAGFLPWLTATAFLHSIMIQERRGMMKIWNVSLIITTFFLTIFGTFMTRSGIVQSVHAFGQDTQLAWVFTVFMVLLLSVSFGFVIKRMPELRSRARLDSWLSREGAFLVNNWILLFAAFFMLFATMFPTISDALFHERITVSAPFFNLWMVPIGLTLLFLTGVGPLIAWRKATPSNLRYQFTTPLIAFAVTLIACLAFGLHKRPVDADIGLVAARRSDRAGAAGAGDELPAAHVRPRQQEVRAGDLLRPVRVRARQHRAGVRARHRDPQAQHRPVRRVGADRHGPARQAALRRLPGPHRHHVDVLRLGGQRLPEREDRQARARPDRDHRRLHHPVRQARARGGPAERDGDR